MTTLLPMSAVIATRNRAQVFERTLTSLRAQSALPADLIVIDASSDDATERVVQRFRDTVGPQGGRVLYEKAAVQGAAAQRNQGIARAREDLVFFFDDDILFENHCVQRLYDALLTDPALGGVSALIVNQTFGPPGRASRFMYRLMAGRPLQEFAGRVLGPAVNLWPEDREGLPDIVPVDWLYTTCTLYRRALLPDPAFDRFFQGYSIGEDLTISLRVGRLGKLANIPHARIFHDTQPGDHKSNAVALSRMHLVNRHYIMTEVLGRRGLSDYVRLALWEMFQISASAVQFRGGIRFWQMFWGRTLGVADIFRHRPAH